MCRLAATDRPPGQASAPRRPTVGTTRVNGAPIEIHSWQSPPGPLVLADVRVCSIARDAILIVGPPVLSDQGQIAILLPFTPVPLTVDVRRPAGAALGSIRGILSMLLHRGNGHGRRARGSPKVPADFSMPPFGYILGFIAGAGLVGLAG